jgi:hypothetical protein
MSMVRVSKGKGEMDGGERGSKEKSVKKVLGEGERSLEQKATDDDGKVE